MTLWPACIAGVLFLALAKILENMEVGHNVMHGQYDWMHDPDLDSNKYEWDIVATGDNWRHSHNFRHHTYTNVDAIDYQLLLEADFLVNAYEDSLSAEAIQSFRDKIFRSQSGIRLLNTMYGV